MKKGISLITLVITIVVVIILAAAVIIALGQNNPISLAKSARDKQSINNIEEEFDIYISSRYAKEIGTFDRESFTVEADNTQITEILPSIKGTEFEGNVSIKNGKLQINLPNRAVVNYIVKDNNKTINGLTPNYDNPIIPVGFRAIDTKDATWNTDNGWRNGLVIEDADGNQFVWIPVYNLGSNDRVEYARWVGGPSDVNTVTSSQVTDDNVPLTGSGDKELAQITKYKGFYVARYEASLPNALVNLSTPMYDLNTIQIPNTTTYYKPESKLNGFVWNYIDYTNAKDVAENAYEIKSLDGNTTFVKSGLITGRQWDTMLKFIEQTKNDDANGNGVNTNSTVWGNCYDRKPININTGYYKNGSWDTSNYINASITSINKTTDGYYLLQTGAFGEATGEHPKNLYDVAGNMWEWSNEKVTEKGGNNTAVGNPLLRGGSFSAYGSASAAFRYGAAGADALNCDVGFRVVLYIL